jgi:hypothetical protein
MAAAGQERSVDSAVETVLNELDAISSLREEQTTTPTAFVEKKDVFLSSLTAISPVSLE